MAQSVNAAIIMKFVANILQSVGLGNGNLAINYPLEFDFTDGAGANKVHQCWSDTGRSIAASSSEALDLSGSLTDAFGNSIAFTKVKAILIKAKNTNVNDVVVGGAAFQRFHQPVRRCDRQGQCQAKRLCCSWRPMPMAMPPQPPRPTSSRSRIAAQARPSSTTSSSSASNRRSRQHQGI